MRSVASIACTDGVACAEKFTKCWLSCSARRALTARDEVAASAQSRGSQYDATDPNSLGELIGNLFVGQSFGKTALEEQAKLGDVSIVADDQVALIQIHREDFLAEMAVHRRYAVRSSSAGRSSYHTLTRLVCVVCVETAPRKL